MDFLVVYT